MVASTNELANELVNKKTTNILKWMWKHQMLIGVVEEMWIHILNY
jgi:hypothetical protein